MFTACRSKLQIRLHHTRMQNETASQSPSLPTLRQPPALALTLALLVVAEPLVLERKHRLAVQALPRQAGRLLGNGRGEGRGVALAARGVLERVVRGRFGVAAAVAVAGLEVFEIERVARREVEAVVVLGDL